MKKHLSVVFVVLVLMAVFTSTVFAAPAQTARNAILVSIQYQESGIVLMFQTSGLTKDDLKNNSFFAHSNSQNMYCFFVDDTTNVRCVVAKKLAEYEGEGFHGTLAGFGFWGDFPRNSYCAEGESKWANIDMFENGELVDSGAVPLWVWDEAAGNGWFEYWEQNYGITYEITSQFCGSDELVGPT